MTQKENWVGLERPRPDLGEQARRAWRRLRSNLKKETAPAEPTLEERKEHVLTLHREIVDTLLGVAAEVNGNVLPDQVDTAGWRYYAFDPSTTTQEQVETVTGSFADLSSTPNIQPLFEINFHPQHKNHRGDTNPLTMSVYLYEYGSTEPVFLEVFPMNSDHIEWTRLWTYYPGNRTRPSVLHDTTIPHIYSEVDVMVPHPECADRVDDVCTLGVPVTQVGNATAQLEYRLEEVAQYVKGIRDGRYRARVFGNSHNSPMNPRFFAPRTQLS